MRHEFLLIFEFAAIFLFRILFEKGLKRKYSRHKDEIQKTKINELWPIFEPFLGNQNGHPELDPRAYVLAEVGAVIREREGGEQKKRNRATERARDGPKRHANYGPSLPVSIPTLAESLAQVCAAQIAQNAQAWLEQKPAFFRHLEGAQGGHIKL